MNPMSQSLFSVVVFIALLALVPWALRWVRRRNGTLAAAVQGGGARVVSALGVGQHQRVVTVEAGPPEARVWLVLGVTPQAITALHTAPAPGFAQSARQAGTATVHDYRDPGHA